MSTASQVSLDLEKSLKIEGWMSLKELAWLASRARESKIIVEIGSFRGRSTRAMADNSSPDTKIYCVDPWTGFYAGVHPPLSTYVYNYFAENLADHIVSDKVIPIREFSDCFDIPELKGSVDFFFIDGDHSYEGCKFDIQLAKQYIRTGGIIAGHDYVNTWPDVMRAVESEFYRIDLDDTIWWTEV